MKAIILAAGLGDRMRPLTDTTHKTLLKVDGRPIIERIVSGLVENAVTKIIVVTGYRSEELITYLRSQFKNVEFEFVHNNRYRATNNIFSLALALEQTNIDDDILLVESDLIYEPDVITKAITSAYPNVALVSPYTTGLDGTVVQVKDNKITNVFPPHMQDERFNLFDKFKTLNIYKFSKEFCEREFKKLLMFYAKVIDDNCYYELILGIIIHLQREVIYCEIIENHKWSEVDDPNDLRDAEFKFNKAGRLSILDNSFGGLWNYDCLDFCFIRNMHFPTKAMISDMRNNLGVLLENYGSKQAILNQKLAYALRCSAGRVLLLNGASQVYPILPEVVGQQLVLLPDPTFGEYSRIFRMAQTYADHVGIDQKDVEDRLALCEVGVFVNPNNPTGTTVATNWLLYLVDKYPGKLFIVDESFIEFSDQPSIMQHLECKARNNVLLVKSMSKSWGVPGLRMGFVYTCNEVLLATIAQRLPIWNLNSLAEFFLEVLLKNRNELVRSFALTMADRHEFANDLKSLKSFDRVYPSGANFLLVSGRNCPDAQTLVKYLIMNESIYLKDVSDKFRGTAERYYRIAVRLSAENKKLVNAIRRFETDVAL